MRIVFKISPKYYQICTFSVLQLTISNQLSQNMRKQVLEIRLLNYSLISALAVYCLHRIIPLFLTLSLKAAHLTLEQAKVDTD